MDANNQNNPGEDAGNNLEILPVQPRQPQNLQGLLRFAIEARQDNPEADNVVPMDNERREFLAEALQNMVMDAVVVLRMAIPVLTDAHKIGSLANKEQITPEIKAVFESVLDIIEDIDVANDFCRLGGFDVFPLCYDTRNPELWENTNNLLAGVCQNFPPGQATALERGLLKKLLDLLNDPDTKNKEKFVYALSCCVREHGPGCRELLALEGGAALARVLREREPRLSCKAACLLRHLLQHHPREAQEKLSTLNLPQTLVPQLDQPINQATEHLLHLLRVCINSPEALSQCRAPDLELKQVLLKILTSPSVLEEPEQNREIIEYANEILAVVFENEVMPVYDCEEEADRSDSECEFMSQRAPVVEKAPKKAATKRKATSSKALESKSRASTSTKSDCAVVDLFEEVPKSRASTSGDLFGLEESFEAPPPSTASGVLASSLVTRVANGKVRRTADINADFFVELKVYSTKEIADTPRQERWKKAQVALKLQLSRDTSNWDALQKFLRRSHEVFESSEAVYFSDNIHFP